MKFTRLRPVFLRVVMLCSVTMFLSGCGSARITDKPIEFGEDRLLLTKGYMEERYGLEDRDSISPKMIVLHWTAIPTLEKSFAAFESSRLPNWRPEIAGAGALNVSAHFLVDRDGTIYRLMPEHLMARHVIGLNHCAIGIENVGGTDATPMTKEQIKANIALVRYLKRKYDIEYVIGHHEYQRFEGHPYWLEKDAGYRTSKSDPGDSFMNAVRSAFPKNTFKPVPNTSSL